MDLADTIRDQVKKYRAQPPSPSKMRVESKKRKGVMSQIAKTQRNVEAAMQSTTQDALESIGSLMALTREARTLPEDQETPQLDYFLGEDINVREDTLEAIEDRTMFGPATADLYEARLEKPTDAKAIDSSSDIDAASEVQPTDGKAFEFEATSKRLVEDLKRDFGLTTMQASAFVGNLAIETDNFSTLQEYEPVVKGSRGGYGFAQWTGPRRKRYEAWTKENNLDPSSYEANYGYLKYELSNEDAEIGNMGKNTIKKLKKATNLNEATSIVMKGYLKPGIPHLDDRQKSAADILGFFD